MEAVPRLPMISFDLKTCPDRQSTDFRRLFQYIRDFYHEDPESYSGEIHKLEALRATALRPASDVTGCAVLKKYYCQLHFLQSRFPMGKDGAAAVKFSWKDTFSNMVFTIADIRFEIVSVLYNIGALHSQLGANDGRSTSEGLKLACTHFQCAAWAFQHLKDTYLMLAEEDLLPNLLQFMYQVCLAQAQECILEKSMTDNRKATINAKVAAQIVEYYNLALSAISPSSNEDLLLVAETVGTKLLKSWKRYVRFKLTYYGCIALLYQGQQSEEQQKMGERMAYYQAAFDKLVEATKLTKGLEHPKVIEEALTFTMDVVEGKRKAAKNENEFIYHEEVPDKDTLPEIKGAALVKGIPFSVTDPEISGPDIFGRLVPMKAHEASSLYSEEKAKLLRRIGEMIDEKDKDLLMYISSLQLDYVNAHLDPETLPQDIVDRCAALSAKPDAIQNLIESMDKLSDIYHDVEAMLKETKELIHSEEIEEKEYQELMGSRPPSIVATDLTREAKKYEEAHQKAAESNKTLHRAMTQHIANLRLLEMPLHQLAQQIPSVKTLNLEQQPIVKEMQHIVSKLEEMRTQRAMLGTQLRESVCSDDITAQLVTRQGENLETIFQEELQKHSKYVTLIEANLAAQDNILKALTESYAQYAPVRKATMEVIKQRNLTLSALMSSYDAYEDLIAKSNKGQEFYRKLETNVTKLLQRVRGTCKVQQEERDVILAKNCKSLPSKLKAPSYPEQTSNPAVPSTGTGAPKLKDYLESYKRDKSGGLTAQNPGTLSNDPYYSSGSLPSSSPSPQPAGYADNVNAPLDSSQSWVPSVRPAPVGQEGTCPSTTTQDLKPDPSLPTYSSIYPMYPATKPYASDGQQYSQPYKEQYSSFMNQYQQYPTSSPYHMQTNPSATYPKSSSSSNLQSYPPNVPNPQSLGYNSSNSSACPVPAPSPTTHNYPQPAPSPSLAAQNYSQPTYDLKTASQGSNIPTTLPQGYSGTGTNLPQQYYQSYQQPVNYPSQVNLQYPNGTSQTYQTQNIPGVQNHPSLNASPQHNYPTAASNVPQVSNYQTPGVNQSYPGVQAYQAATTVYSQPAVSQPPQPSLTSVDQTITNNFSKLQVKPTDVASAAYSPSATLNYSANIPNQEKTVTGGRQLYSQYQNFPVGSYNTYTNTAVTQGANQQYSSYTPQMYTAYMNSEQYSKDKNYASTQPWQTTYEVKNAQEYSMNFYYANVNPNQPSVSEVQHMQDDKTSCYTQAGQPLGSQTSVSMSQSTSMVTGAPSYTQGNYYSQPYGYQYTNASCESPSAAVNLSQVTVQGQMTPQSPMTYMHASNSSMKLTFSQESSTTQSASDSASNVDLLAGLDFSVSQDPLVPQQKASSTDTPTKTPSKPSVTATDVLEEKLAPEVVVPAAISPEPVSLTPKRVVETKKSERFQLKDPFNDLEVLNQFTQEVEKFEKFVEGLTTKTLNGPTPLDIKWKELLDLQEKDSVKHSISVARCYPVKNRFPDILPYDNSRVELPSTKDDYINASYVKDVTENLPDFIVTQLPLPSTFGDFWTMVLEQQVELVVCLLNDSEMENSVYWPREKGVEMVAGRVKLTLQSTNTCKHWVERIIYISDGKLSRVVVHLQFSEWPGSLFPSSPGPFLSLVSEGLSVRAQQRGGGPCVVHCLSGVGRSGLYLLLCAAVCQIHSQSARGLPDLAVLAAHIASCRKNALRDREHFKFAYQALLYYSQDLLMKRGILASRSSFEDKRTKSHTRHPSEDFLLGPPKDITQPQSSPEKKPSDPSASNEENLDKSSDPLSQLDPLWTMKK